MKRGIFYGVGVGPGDPELMTLQAVRIIRESRVIAVPGENAQDSLAYKIAVQAVPELAGKQLLALPMPMTCDAEITAAAHRKAAEQAAAFLERGEDVAFLTLGDPALYSTFFYVQRLLQQAGHQTAVSAGIPAVCAAAAALGIPLVQGDTPLHILPCLMPGTEALPGTVAVMKCGRHLPELRERLAGRMLYAVENCGLPGEKRCIGELPETAGYFTVVIAKENAE